jgi:hypothetical protein
MPEQRRCGCVADHNPEPQELHVHHIWPLGWRGPDDPANTAVLCPTTHANVHEYLRALRAWEPDPPPYLLRKHFSAFARALAAEGHNRWIVAGRP